MNRQELAERLLAAAREAKPVAQLTAEHPALTVAEGYGIQDSLLALWRARGVGAVGFKAGLTSLAKQREVNVATPIFGRLLSNGDVPDGGAVERARFIHPRSEPEIAFVLRERLFAGATVEDARRAVASAHLALEIVDSRYRDFRFTLPDVVADNTSAAAFVLGGPIERASRGLALLGVWIRKNGELMQTGAGAAALGDPLRSVAALAQVVPGGLPAGSLILTGGLTQSVPFERGDFIEAECSDGATASFRAV